jgi:hypothetical protein
MNASSCTGAEHIRGLRQCSCWKTEKGIDWVLCPPPAKNHKWEFWGKVENGKETRIRIYVEE